MTRGYLLLAQKRAAYVRMALNLAMSLKDAGTEYPVCLLTDDTGRLDDFPVADLFDQVIYLERADNQPFYTKTRLNHYSPFEQTLYIDVDSLCLKNPDPLFDLNFGFCSQITRSGNMGTDRGSWADPVKVFQHHKIPAVRVWHELNTSIMIFDREQESRDVFAIAEELYAARHYPGWKGTVGFYPDELAFNAACALMALEPAISPKEPILFIRPSGKIPDFRKLPPERFFMSLYGDYGTCHPHAWRHYNQEAIRLGRKFDVPVLKVSSADKAASDTATRRYAGIRTVENKEIDECIKKYKD